MIFLELNRRLSWKLGLSEETSPKIVPFIRPTACSVIVYLVQGNTFSCDFPNHGILVSHCGQSRGKWGRGEIFAIESNQLYWLSYQGNFMTLPIQLV